MYEGYVEVPFGDDAGATATLLLAAAEELELSADVVRTTTDGVFLVPEEVADKAKPTKKGSKAAAPVEGE